MSRMPESAELLKCSFCGKSQKQVRKLIAGPGVYICDECIELCNEIIEEELLAVDPAESSAKLPKPYENRHYAKMMTFCRFLRDYRHKNSTKSFTQQATNAALFWRPTWQKHH